MLPTLEELSSQATFAKTSTKADRFKEISRKNSSVNNKYLHYYDPGYTFKNEGVQAMNGLKLNGDIIISIGVGDVLSLPPVVVLGILSNPTWWNGHPILVAAPYEDLWALLLKEEELPGNKLLFFILTLVVIIINSVPPPSSYYVDDPSQEQLDAAP